MIRCLPLLLLLASGPVWSGKDRDRTRKVPEGHQVYTGERLAVGAVAEAFLLQYPADPAWKISPSRYAVNFESAAFRFRNQPDFSVTPAMQNKWLRVVFEVVTVTENAVEAPKGSGNWTWVLTYECDLRAVELIE